MAVKHFSGTLTASPGPGQPREERKLDLIMTSTVEGIIKTMRPGDTLVITRKA